MALDFLERTFPGEDDEVAAEVAGKLHAGGAGDGHLGRDVDREIGRVLANQPADADILHDRGVHPGRDHRPHVLLGLGHLVLEDEDVEGDIALHAAPVQELHQPGQIGLGEVVGPHAGVELLQPEVDRVRAVLDGGPGAFPIARRREQLGQASCASGRELPAFRSARSGAATGLF